MIKKIFKSVNPEVLNENFFKLDNEWMLVTAGTPENFNTMTASWGTFGILWNKPVAICFVRPQRYTFGFAEKNEIFTLSFFEDQHKEVLNYCGTHSGKNVDKMAITGLKPLDTPEGGISFEQSRLIIECRKIYADFLKEDNFLRKSVIGQLYSRKDFHKFFIGEITGCFVKV
jgi:flavin reductase (DIM6/NTAB) family NADH-FMN oxidoreductase RutF